MPIVYARRRPSQKLTFGRGVMLPKIYSVSYKLDKERPQAICRSALIVDGLPNENVPESNERKAAHCSLASRMPTSV